MKKTSKQISLLKETENIVRFEIRCIFANILPTEEMLVKVRHACASWYEKNPGKSDVPSSVFMDILQIK